MIETDNLSFEYTEKARIGPGGWKKLVKGRITGRKLLGKLETEEREKDEVVAARAKAKVDRVRTGERRMLLRKGPGQHRKSKRPALLRFVLRPEDSLTKPRVTSLFQTAQSLVNHRRLRL